MVKGLFILIVAAVAFVIYALIDCLFTERYRFRALNKPIWALVIVILPLVGALLWFGLGRRSRGASNRRVVAPDDDPDFLGERSAPMSASDRESVDERIRRLEQELAEHDDDGPTGKLK
ncbi:hypothetical protein GCM10025867_40120 [Frondihabitans sucicola]|uniref:Cardiolipin synthase N-terminal domain-containing protein n=1 Tax=Frondihabitans sucicola TaxID=1268041 RepID=A0ABN6Y3W6_9MICO|nr:PLD nuclease N-terminal domain-containing protein [Frondihabitans sucicola]BDZ51771.1 hypothetical protein GCM10025867_40120 [Frondihabitans sucicola]